MIIAFTGHRDSLAPAGFLERIAAEYPGATWRHGGAVGFDSQVSKFAAQNGIIQQTILPDYNRFGDAAPLIRNRDILHGAKLLVALYDGRKSGGTLYTIQEARRQGISIRFAGIEEQPKQAALPGF